MERQPIVSQKEAFVKLVQTPLVIEGMLPSYRYEFQNQAIPEEAQKMYNDLLEFLKTNEELIINEPLISREDYIKGFQKAIAVTRLWIDSIYLKSD